MTMLSSVFLMVFAVAQLVAEEKKAVGKRHEYTPAKLPKVVKAKVGDSIIVTYEIKPADVEEMAGGSDDPNVTVKAAPGKGKVEITIRATKKGKAKVDWEIRRADGRVERRKDLEVRFD